MPCSGVLIMGILLFRVLYWGSPFPETPITIISLVLLPEMLAGLRQRLQATNFAHLCLSRWFSSIKFSDFCKRSYKS